MNFCETASEGDGIRMQILFCTYFIDSTPQEVARDSCPGFGLPLVCYPELDNVPPSQRSHVLPLPSRGAPADAGKPLGDRGEEGHEVLLIPDALEEGGGEVREAAEDGGGHVRLHIRLADRQRQSHSQTH